MKSKKSKQKLSLNKTTITDLSSLMMEKINGGWDSEECQTWEATCNSCGPGYPGCTNVYDCNTDDPRICDGDDVE